MIYSIVNKYKIEESEIIKWESVFNDLKMNLYFISWKHFNEKNFNSYFKIFSKIKNKRMPWKNDWQNISAKLDLRWNIRILK